ncbi:hypothetical protein MHW47_04050 [Streptomyces sp. OfavH-34-F]|uniref:hypothetical protein n=1 Tax=Streptomyces sp. OfavH-34-F TaxID=2917760 RepID=UPI001EF34D82|nr:hypothetical protein [Streptomyces sp. OfavH-34-F]MCG7523620.1 hypothetical protein [Streptomyces sp. OfavH-34-F]
MPEFLTRLGQQLAERWLTLLALPGALYLAVAQAAQVLGHAHPFDLARLTRRLTAWAGAPPVHSFGGQVVLLAGVLAASAAVGIAARTLGAGIERVVLAADWDTWPQPLRRLAGSRVAARRRRWDTARHVLDGHRRAAARAAALRKPHDAEALHEARRRLERIAPERPARPTWVGDRVRATGTRVRRDHRIDLAVLWPHLWLTLPDTDRAELSAARGELAASTALAAWSLLYAPLAVVWWPAAGVSLLLLLTARHRTRAAAESYARLVEATVRLRTVELLGLLGVDHSGPLSDDVGDVLNDLLDSRLPVLEAGPEGAP